MTYFYTLLHTFQENEDGQGRRIRSSWAVEEEISFPCFRFFLFCFPGVTNMLYLDELLFVLINC